MVIRLPSGIPYLEICSMDLVPVAIGTKSMLLST